MLPLFGICWLMLVVYAFRVGWRCAAYSRIYSASDLMCVVPVCVIADSCVYVARSYLIQLIPLGPPPGPRVVPCTGKDPPVSHVFHDFCLVTALRLSHTWYLVGDITLAGNIINVSCSHQIPNGDYIHGQISITHQFVFWDQSVHMPLYVVGQCGLCATSELGFDHLHRGVVLV